jgi:hypothetical protein
MLLVSVPTPVPDPAPVRILLVSVPVIVVESDELEELPELLQLNAAHAIITINNARLMIFIFIND